MSNLLCANRRDGLIANEAITSVVPAEDLRVDCDRVFLVWRTIIPVVTNCQKVDAILVFPIMVEIIFNKVKKRELI